MTLRRPQRMLPKERDHRSEQILAPSHHVSVQMVAMIVMTTIHDHLSDAEVLLEFVQSFDAALALRDYELVEHLCIRAHRRSRTCELVARTR